VDTSVIKLQGPNDLFDASDADQTEMIHFITCIVFCLFGMNAEEEQTQRISPPCPAYFVKHEIFGAVVRVVS
jgi:hypothetical protein